MARSDDPNSNGGQFFLVYQDTQLPTDGGGYCIFGKVTEGMDIVDAVAQQGVARREPVTVLRSSRSASCRSMSRRRPSGLAD